MKKIIMTPLLLFMCACAGGSYTDYHGSDGFNPRECLNVPIGIESFQYMDPSLKNRKISCATLAKCAAFMGGGAPPNVPCE